MSSKSSTNKSKSAAAVVAATAAAQEKAMTVVFAELVDEVALELIFQVHRQAKLTRSVCPICNQMCRSFVSQPGKDIFGNSCDGPSNDTCACLNCNRKFPTARYANHLEKCLGLGRVASRSAAQRR